MVFLSNEEEVFADS